MILIGLKTWCDKWLLKVNPKKCVSMTVFNKSEPELAEKKCEYHMGTTNELVPIARI